MQSRGSHRDDIDDSKPKRVTDLLQEGFDSFSRSQKAIARYIIDHLEETAYLSAEELARKGNTSSSTVVRFAQSLGFSGYPDLQKATRDEHRLGAASRPVVHDDQLLFLVEEDNLTRALRTDILSLEETLAKNTLARFNQAVEIVSGARHLMLVGMNEASIVVRHAAYLFDLLGFATDLVVDTSEAHVARLVRLGPEDALLAVGFRRAHPLTISFLEKAGASKARTVALTDNSLSEIAGKASVTLYADIDSTFFAHSLVGPLSLVTALAAAMYAQDRDACDARIKLVREHVGESGWLR
jgi:DNA-binding MurR/RpiR family transcriptional regulator